MYLFTLSTYQKKYSKRVRTQKKSKVFDITAMRVNPQKLRWKLIEYLFIVGEHRTLYKSMNPVVTFKLKPLADWRQRLRCINVLWSQPLPISAEKLFPPREITSTDGAVSPLLWGYMGAASTSSPFWSSAVCFKHLKLLSPWSRRSSQLAPPPRSDECLSLDKPGTRDPTVSISFLLKSLYSSYIQLEQVQLVHLLRMPSRCAIRNKNSVRLHTYIDHVRPRQKEKKVLPMLVCSVGADVGPSFGFHDGIGNRIPIPVHNLTLDTYEKRRGKKDHNCQWVSLPL